MSSRSSLQGWGARGQPFYELGSQEEAGGRSMVFCVLNSFLGKKTQHSASEEGGQGRVGAEVVHPPTAMCSDPQP